LNNDYHNFQAEKANVDLQIASNEFDDVPSIIDDSQDNGEYYSHENQIQGPLKPYYRSKNNQEEDFKTSVEPTHSMLSSNRTLNVKLLKDINSSDKK
jgi:hypothetical protein